MGELSALICFLFALTLFLGFYIKQYLSKRRIGKISKEKIEEHIKNKFSIEKDNIIKIFFRRLKRESRLLYKKMYFNVIYFGLRLKTKDFKKTFLVFLIILIIIAGVIFYSINKNDVILIPLLILLAIVILIFKFMGFDQIFPNKEDVYNFFDNKYKNNEYLKINLLEFDIEERNVGYTAAVFSNNYDDVSWNYRYNHSYMDGLNEGRQVSKARDRKVNLKVILGISYYPNLLNKSVIIKAFKNLQIDLQLVGGMIEIEESKITFTLSQLKGNEKKAFILLCQFVDICNIFLDTINEGGLNVSENK